MPIIYMGQTSELDNENNHSDTNASDVMLIICIGHTSKSDKWFLFDNHLRFT